MSYFSIVAQTQRQGHKNTEDKNTSTIQPWTVVI
jgi:hypothetical protein